MAGEKVETDMGSVTSDAVVMFSWFLFQSMAPNECVQWVLSR